ncbi:hypothetical protein LTS18_005582, partial [Coniosporium uncinatum]
MAQSYNGQYYYGQPPAQPTSGQYQSHYGPPADHYDEQNQQTYGSYSAEQSYTDPYGQSRSGNTSVIPGDELFIGGAPLPPLRSSPGASRYQSSTAQPTYNPQAYGPPVGQSSPLFSSHKTSTSQVQIPSYNPADYTSDNLQRQSSSAGYANNYAPSPLSPTTPYSPTSQATYGYQSPTTQQQYGRQYGRTSVYGTSYASQPNPPPVPPRINPSYSQASSAPLATIPASATSSTAHWGNLPTTHGYGYSQGGYSGTYLNHSNLPSPPAPGYGGSRQSSVSDFQSPSPAFSDNQNPTPGPPPPEHAPQRSGTNRHPRNNPLPGLPPEAGSSGDYAYFAQPNGGARFNTERDIAEGMSQDDLFENIEQLTRGTGGSASSRSPRIEVDPAADHDNYLSWAEPRRDSEHTNGRLVNGHLTPGSGSFGYEGSDSDAVADAGTVAMSIADEEEETDRRASGSSAFLTTQIPQATSEEEGFEDDGEEGFGNIDLTSFGGGDFNPSTMNYGGDDPNDLILRHSNLALRRVESENNIYGRISSTNSLRRSLVTSERSDGYGYDESVHPFPPFARTDIYGTGGLADPSDPRRNSFDANDDEALMDNASVDQDYGT